MEKESFVTPNSLYHGITKNASSPYVMQGKACDKTLDIYHLYLHLLMPAIYGANTVICQITIIFFFQRK